MEKQKKEVRDVINKFPVLGKKYSELKTFGEKRKFVENTNKGLERVEKDKKAKEAVKVVITKLNNRLVKQEKLEIKKNAKNEWKNEKKKKEELEIKSKKTGEASKVISKTMNTIVSANEARKLLKRKIPVVLKDGNVFMYDTEKSREENRKDMLDLYGKI